MDTLSHFILAFDEVRFIERLQKKGYSQEKMAELLGVSHQHIASVEVPGMNRGVSLELIFNIATVLEIEPYLLFKFRIEK